MDQVDLILKKRGIGAARPVFLHGAQVRAIATELGLGVREAIITLLGHDIWPERYSRNYGVLTARQQAKLLGLRALIVGCGGLGGEVAPMLARVGVGCYRLCDPDVFEENNFNRQRYCTEQTLGLPKPAVVADGLLEIASFLEVEALAIAAQPQNLPELLKDVDVAIDCLDSVARKKMLENAASAAGVAYLHGSVLWDEALVYLDMPGRNRLELIYPEIQGAHKSMGINHVVASTVAGAAALMVALLLDGFIRESGARTPVLHMDYSVPELMQFGCEQDH